MTNQNWREMYDSIFKPLANIVIHGTTSISKLKNDNTAFAHGTGSYIKYKDQIYLITNDHVVKEGVGAHLSHIPGPTKNYMLCKSWLNRGYPIDIALSRITNYWDKATKTCFEDKFDEKYQPVENEFMLWVGYPGTTLSRHDVVTENRIRSVYFDVLDSPAIPFVTAVKKDFDLSGIKFDENHHFAIHYPENGNIRGEIILNALPNPKGLSGSLVWDTKYIKTINERKEWTPDLARICGILWADYPKGEVVFATKIESVLEAIDEIHSKYAEALEKFNIKE